MVATLTSKQQLWKGCDSNAIITSAEEKAQRRLEVKARSTLMIGIPNEHQLKFNSIKDAKKLLEDIEKRFGGNEATKKTQRNLLKQQYENFTAPSSEMLDQTFDKLQKLMSQLELLGEKMNKADLDTMSIDDLYNNLKVYEPEVKGMSSSSLINAANSTNIDNLSDAVICAFFASQPNSPQLLHEDLQQIYLDDMEEMDLRWQMAMLTMRARRFLKNTALEASTIKLVMSYWFDKSNVKCSTATRGTFCVECMSSTTHPLSFLPFLSSFVFLFSLLSKNTTLTRQRTLSSEGGVQWKTSTSTALVSCDSLGGYDWSNQAEDGPNYALMDFSSSSPDSEIFN
ncbi:hypothetical protein Tco_0833987 [Tanacetum coccineum]